MIVHITSYQKTICLEFADANSLPCGFLPSTESSWNAAREKLEHADSAGCQVYVDFMWELDDQADPAWLQTEFGYPRSALIQSRQQREMFIAEAARRYPTPYVCAPSGNPDEPAASVDYVREALHVRDQHFPDKPVLASFAFTRSGLRSRVPVAGMYPLPNGTDFISIAVVDSASYPSVWSEDDWREWLLLVASLARAGYQVLVPHADVRGLPAIALGAADFGTAASQKWRQLRPYSPGSSGGGGSSSKSYLSAPLLAVVDGDNAALLQQGRDVESHQDALADVQLNLPPVAVAGFDPAWQALGQPKGAVDGARLNQHLSSLLAIETAVRSSPSPIVQMQSWLDAADALGQKLPGEIFRSAGTRDELGARARAFGAVVADLGL